jgi:hypothetical protein
MSNIKTFFSILLLSGLFLSSCDLFRTETEIEPDNPNIVYSGRIDSTNPKSIRFDWSGVQIKTVFDGTSCRIKLKDGNNDYNVFIDDRFHKVLRTDSNEVYILAENLLDKKHTLLITKRTEAIFGTAAFEGFILDAGKTLYNPGRNNKRKIEIIGDSFVAGFGSKGTTPDCKFSRETEDNFVSFGPMLARRFNADYSVVAISGAGVVKNYGDTLRASEYPFPYYYPKTCMNDTLPWNFKLWQPDAIVIRLGRNDYWLKPHPRRSMFRTGYVNLLKTIRRNYPRAHIFAICGPMRKDPHCDYIKSAVNELKYDLRDKKVHFVKLAIDFDSRKDFGCEKHPNRSGHYKIANALEPIMRKALKWEDKFKLFESIIDRSLNLF